MGDFKVTIGHSLQWETYFYPFIANSLGVDYMGCNTTFFKI